LSGYDDDLKNIFNLQDQITQQVIAALIAPIQMNIGDHVKPFERHDIRTWDLLAQGRKLTCKLI
jgi:hypothetical protein